LVGILSGIDYDQWDPRRDPNLPEAFSASNLEGKQAARRVLLDAYHLSSENAHRVPIVALLSPLVGDQGFDLLEVIADELPRLGAIVVQLGRGERRFEDLWLAMAARYPDRIGARIDEDERLAHLVLGGSDLLLMPSRVEPAGERQMQAMRYGTVPLVYATGGLADSVRNYTPPG